MTGSIRRGSSLNLQVFREQRLAGREPSQTMQLSCKQTKRELRMTEAEEEFSTVAELLGKAVKVDYQVPPAGFVRDVYGLARVHGVKGISLGKALAALFDLAVTAVYLERVPTSNWYYCNQNGDPELVYAFVNACPACTLEGEFHHLKAGKPGSANIGKATSTILAAFLDMQARTVKGTDYEVRTVDDNGLVDACLIGPKTIGLFEIKSAPLMAFPMSMPSSALTSLDDTSGELVASRSHVRANVPEGGDASLLIDETLRIPVGDPHLFRETQHYSRIVEWLSVEENFSAFVESWTKTFNGYSNPANRGATHWLTNGCGSPRPRPLDWPERRSQGYETISDGKSSVGLDRTDDVKKGIYQVLKISTHYKEFFPSGDWDVYAALVTNIHAVKHHDDYLKELEDVVWTVDGGDRSYVVSRDDETTVIETDHLYNLFDGVIAFTKSYFRADMLRDIYDFEL